MTGRYLSASLPRAALAAGLALSMAVVSPAAAQTAAAAAYERAVAREDAARNDAGTAVTTLRAIATSYEAIVRRYPSSGYADNSLWQGAGVLESAFAKSHDAADRDGAIRLLNWLKKEYPGSKFRKQIDGRVSALQPDAAASPTPVNPPPTATSVAQSSASSDAAAPPSTPPVPPAVPAAAATQSPSPGGSTAVLRSITQTALPKGNRITIELSREVPYSGDRVDNPDRVFFDLANASAASSVSERLVSPSGSLVKSVRIGKHATGVTRVVLELDGHPRYSAFPLYEPFRLVIDVESDGVAATRALAPVAAPVPTPVSAPLVVAPIPPPSTVITSAPAEKVATPSATISLPAPPSITSRGDYSLARQLGLGVSRIVIDAGHGGHDPGAQANGINEADLVLDVAQRLEKLLRDQPGFQVVLTRSTDTFIPLEERTAIANREGADLFLSIHANASRQTAAHGIETYFLNFATNPQAEAVAARENATSVQTMGGLPEILKAIALNNKLAESRELATIVQTSLMRRLVQQNKALRDLGVKQAPFVVLIGAQMPSVLAEISFLTNKSEAVLLKQTSYRQRIAQALCDSILKYQASLKKVTTVAAGPTPKR